MKNFISRFLYGAPADDVTSLHNEIEDVSVRLEAQQRVTDKIVRGMENQYQIIRAVAGEMIPEIRKELSATNKEVRETKKEVRELREMIETGKHKRWRARSETMETLVYKNLGDDIEC